MSGMSANSLMDIPPWTISPPLPTRVSSTQNMGEWLFGAKINVGAKTRTSTRKFYCMVNLHDLWSNYPRSVWHVIDLEASADSGGHGSPFPRRNATVPSPLALTHFPLPWRQIAYESVSAHFDPLHNRCPLTDRRKADYVGDFYTTVVNLVHVDHHRERL